MRWPTTRQKCRTQTRLPFLFSNSPHATIYRGGQKPLETMASAKEKKGESVSRRDTRATLFIPPSCVAPSLIREGTHETSSFFIPSPRSTAPSFLHVNPLARIQCMYIRTYIYIFQSRVSKPSWPRNTETSYSNLWNYSRMNFRGEKIQFNGLRRQLMDS